MQRLTALATCALALVALTAAPAGAGSHGAAAFSELCAGWETFSSLARLEQASPAGRGYTRAEPVLRVGPTDSEIPGGRKPVFDPSFEVTVPTHVHVVHDGADGLIPQPVVAQQLEVLNDAFAGGYDSDAHPTDTGFYFMLASLDYTDRQDWYEATPLSPEEFAMKDALGVGGGTELNLYLTKGGGLLGWAFVPRIRVWDKKYEVLDGVVVNSGSVPGGPIENYDLGHTVTHEVGHWLGLEHTFEKGCLGDGDRVDDTPPQLVPTEGCPVGKDTCPEAGLDPVRNFMDYSYDACYEEFTDGQAARMQAQYLHWRLKH